MSENFHEGDVAAELRRMRDRLEVLADRAATGSRTRIALHRAADEIDDVVGEEDDE